MNRQQRRQAERVCRREGHLTKNDGEGKLWPVCVRCGTPVSR